MTDADVLVFIKHTLRSHIPDSSYRLFLFGSRATGTAKKFSDVDVGIEGPKPVDYETIAAIEEDLESSLLPVKVDVIDFSQTSDRFRTFAKKYAQPL